MPNRRLQAATLTLITIVSGLVWRLAPLHLPRSLQKHGGSILWALAIYCLLATLLPRASSRKIALAAAALSAAVEAFKLYHSPAFDAFRLTLAGKLLLGRVFSWNDIAAYWVAIAIAALIDAHRRNRTESQVHPTPQGESLS